MYKRQVHTLIEAIEYLKGAFELKSQEFKDVLKMGRTQLQDAVPMTVGKSSTHGR